MGNRILRMKRILDPVPEILDHICREWDLRIYTFNQFFGNFEAVSLVPF